MLELSLQKNSLVLYKSRPGCVVQIGEKVEIKLETGKTYKVRPKDIDVLHPGPIQSLKNLTPPPGDVETAWELLAGETTTLPELAELAYNEFSPASAWATWQLVADGLYFRGDINTIKARLFEDVAKTKAERAAKEAEKEARESFLNRVRGGSILPKDTRYLKEVETLALGQQEKSKILRDLGQNQSPENAHALLLKSGYWNHATNPYPQRMKVVTTSSETVLPDLTYEHRLDLTHLPAFAIDDAGSNDPDDAISLDGNRLWVHVADVAALVQPNSPADLEARARGANLYLPEDTVTMLPHRATELLGLGLSNTSPALSFGIDITGKANEIKLVEIAPSRVRVQRFSYEEVETRINDDTFGKLYQLSQMFAARRRANGAIELNLPEVKIRVKDGQVVIYPLPPLKSRDMVREAMLMAGESVARFALEKEIPLLFSTQDAPDSEDGGFTDTMSGMFARRRTLTRSRLKNTPAPHAGLGLDFYAQTTSPLRRYADLVIHQQLRAYLRKTPLLTEAEMLERVGAAEAVAGSVRQTERLSNKHWTLVYLLQNLNWQGEGVLVEQRRRRGRILIPELDLETNLHLSNDFPLDSHFSLSLSSINLPELEGHFRAID